MSKFLEVIIYFLRRELSTTPLFILGPLIVPLLQYNQATAIQRLEDRRLQAPHLWTASVGATMHDTGDAGTTYWPASRGRNLSAVIELAEQDETSSDDSDDGGSKCSFLIHCKPLADPTASHERRPRGSRAGG